MLQDGVGRVDITPPNGIAHAGWGAQTHQVSEGSDMPLYVTALVLSRGELQVAIIDVDIAVFSTTQDQDIRTELSDFTDIPFSHIRLAYSHTHSAPVTFSDWIPSRS